MNKLIGLIILSTVSHVRRRGRSSASWRLGEFVVLCRARFEATAAAAAAAARMFRPTINLANSIVGVSILAMPYCFKEVHTHTHTHTHTHMEREMGGII